MWQCWSCLNVCKLKVNYLITLYKTDALSMAMFRLEHSVDEIKALQAQIVGGQS